MFKRYADDYVTEITQDESGRERKEAVYRGKFFEVELAAEELVRFKKNSLLLLGWIILVHVAAGFVDNKGMYQFYIAFAYVLTFFPLIYMAAGVFRLPKERRKFRRDEIGLSFERIKSASRIIFVLLCMGLLGEIAYLVFFSGGNEPALEFVFMALEALAAFAAFLTIQMHRKISIGESKE